MGLEKDQIKTYHDDGAVVVRGLLKKEQIDNCLQDIEFLFTDQANKYGMMPKNPKGLDDIILSVMKPGTPERKFVYDMVRNVRSVQQIAHSPIIYEILKDLGMGFPIALELPTIRIDITGETNIFTPKHQDVRSVRSPRCTTVWFPFRPVNDKRGSIAVYRGSQAFGVLEYEIKPPHNTIAEADLKKIQHCEKMIVEAEPGDIVFMNALSVHESHHNTSDTIKLNGQIIYNDGSAIKLGDEYQDLKNVPDYHTLIDVSFSPKK